MNVSIEIVDNLLVCIYDLVEVLRGHLVTQPGRSYSYNTLSLELVGVR